MQIKKDIMWRINGSFILLCIMGVFILGQILRIQFAEGDKWRDRADSLTLRINTIEANRGNIFSADGRLISTSVPIYDIRMDTRASGLTREVFNSSIDSLSIALSSLFKDRSAYEYKTMIREARNRKDRYYLIHRNVSYADLQKVKKFPLFRLGKYKGGLCIDQKEIRQLPFQLLAARTIGYVRDIKPVGIEASFNEELKGVSGKRLMQRISGNVWMPVTDKDIVEPRDGHDIITTIDVNIQDVAENSLEQHLRSHNADHGCAVLMEVETGEIKAIANLSRNSRGEYAEDFNYVIAEATEPGSTMKLASLLAAIDDGFIEPNDTINVGNGQYNFFRQQMKDSHAPHASRLSIQQIFETSSNVGVSKAIWSSYVKRPQDFIDKLKSFGLSEPLNLQIQGEGKSKIKNTSDKSWSAVSLPWISIGYEVALTPLQILTFYNGIANNGRVVQPQFVKEIKMHGKTVKTFPVRVLRDSIASQKSIEIVKKMMEGVVQNEHGTGRFLKSSPYRIAGKTGTAQIANPKFGYDKSHRAYQASFVGYFPADAPKYSCMVVVYAPSNDVYYGGAVAGPIFKDIADKVYSTHIELHSAPSDSDSTIISIPFAKAGHQKQLRNILLELDVPVESGDEEAMIVSTKSTIDQLLLVERKNQKGIVPDVTGMGMRDALFILENAGLRVNCTGKGKVIKQTPSPGKKITKGQTAMIEFGL